MRNKAIESRVESISLSIARPFIEKHHYSARVPTGKNIFFGWYIKDDSITKNSLFGETLYAVSNYGIGVNPYQAPFLSRISGEPITNENLLELKRLCRVEPKSDKLHLSSFLSKCHKKLKRDGYKYIVSFSDPTHGHTGGIYRASNFNHMGQTNQEFHVIDRDGEIRHRRYYYRYAKRNNITAKQARDDLGLKRIKTLKKDRWLIKIN